MEEASTTLRRFYSCAEDVLFPKAVIDKLIGDEVMALYLPALKRDIGEDEVPSLMLEHARELLRQGLSVEVVELFEEPPWSQFKLVIGTKIAG